MIDQEYMVRLLNALEEGVFELHRKESFKDTQALKAILDLVDNRIKEMIPLIRAIRESL